jgi:hypothetical protein
VVGRQYLQKYGEEQRKCGSMLWESLFADKES